jgi:hypothetical protein
MSVFRDAEPKTKPALQAAQATIKRFIVKCYYGIDDYAEADSARLVFNANYACTNGLRSISSIVFELEGTHTRGGICALIIGRSSGADGKEALIGPVGYLSKFMQGDIGKKATEEERDEVRRAMQVFLKEARVPISGVEPITAENASSAIMAFTELKRTTPLGFGL